MKRYLAIATALMLAAGSLLAAAPSSPSQGEIVIGLQCDARGPICSRGHDYVGS